MDFGWLKHLNDGFISYKHIDFPIKRYELSQESCGLL